MQCPYTHTRKDSTWRSFTTYTKIHGRPPAELDMQRYFRVSSPSVHQMVLTLEKRGLIERVPWQARLIRLLLSREELPDLE